MGGLRARLAFALVGLVVITVLGIGIGAYVFVDARLRDGLLVDAERQAQFNLSVLIPDRLPANADSAAFARSGLAETFRLRGDVETIVQFGPGDTYVSSPALAGALASVPQVVGDAVVAGHLGYAWTTLAGESFLVVGGRQGQGPAFYFLSRTATIDAALGQLRIGLIAGGLVATLLAAAAAGLLARRILGPVRQGSIAAARIAAGDLGARVPLQGTDELAGWAAEFNRMAATLQSTVERLEASQRQNRRFVADVAHELRTPLTALVAEASMIEGGLDALAPEPRRAAELLVADVRRVRGLVEDLMELSRFDARAEEATLAPLDLRRAVGAIVAAHPPAASLEPPPPGQEAIVVEADVRRLDRILGNLLDNARAHAPRAEVRVTVEADPAAGAATVTVADRGPGVAADALPHLFERFYKADRSHQGGGSGLGLAIASEHAALLGGELLARNGDGGGLEVTLRLPVSGSLPAGDEAAT